MSFKEIYISKQNARAHVYGQFARGERPELNRNAMIHAYIAMCLVVQPQFLPIDEMVPLYRK